MKDLTKIKLFAMDVDGTLTDGNIYMGNDANSHAECNRLGVNYAEVFLVK